MTRVTCKIKDVISEVKSGDWGKGSPTENYTTEVLRTILKNAEKE